MTHSSSSATPPKTPLSPFFDSPPQSPIPLAFIFCIIAISAHLLHVPLLVSSARLPTFPKSFQPHIEVRMIPELIVAPLISLVMKKDLAQTLFWTIPVVVAGVLLQAERWIIEGREAVDRLERLKYTSKGV
jgi:undecaprenyl pyrophosphate phosphatase UppP